MLFLFMQWKITRLLKSSAFYALIVWYEIILIFTVLPEIKQSFEQRKIKSLVEQDSKSPLSGFICLSAGSLTLFFCLLIRTAGIPCNRHQYIAVLSNQASFCPHSASASSQQWWDSGKLRDIAAKRVQTFEVLLVVLLRRGRTEICSGTIHFFDH